MQGRVVAVREAASLRFRRGEAGRNEVQTALGEIVAELCSSGDVPTDEAGVDAAELDELVVHEEGQGVDPVTATILIGGGTKLTLHVLEKLWDDVLWPRLKKRLGGQAVGNRIE